MAGMRPIIGIMACPSPGCPPFRESTTYAAMDAAANRLGAELAVFSPSAAAGSHAQLDAYQLQPKEGWKRKTIRLPDVVLERTFCSGPEERLAVHAARNALAEQGVLLLSGRLGGKLAAYRILSDCGSVLPFLPATEPFGWQGIFRRLSEKGAAFVKPDGGSQGLGCVRLYAEAASGATRSGSQAVHRYRAEGRDFRNHPFSQSFAGRKELALWLKSFTAGRSFLVQDFLRLTGRGGCPYDLRSLVQKDGAGNWSITGIAVRQGRKSGSTANLHGGGRALPAPDRLTEEFGAERAAALLKQISSLSLRIAGLLEERYGRLVELGLDFGIDTEGRLWFLEANSRPGRTAFRLIGDRLAEEQSASRPVAYALRLATLAPVRLFSSV